VSEFGWGGEVRWVEVRWACELCWVHVGGFLRLGFAKGDEC